MIIKNKVLAYIFRKTGEKNEVLVFDHRNDPEVNPQVPAGTVDTDEAPEKAVLREILEESGLIFSKHNQYLGCFEYFRDDIQELHQRHVYTFVSENLPDKWEHLVSGGGEDQGLIFDYYWLKIEDAKNNLVIGLGEYLYV